MTQNQASKATLPFGCSHRYKNYTVVIMSWLTITKISIYPQSPTRLSSHLSMRNMAGVLMKQYKNIFFWKKETPSALKHTTRKNETKCLIITLENCPIKPVLKRYTT